MYPQIPDIEKLLQGQRLNPYDANVQYSGQSTGNFQDLLNRYQSAPQQRQRGGQRGKPRVITMPRPRIRRNQGPKYAQSPYLAGPGDMASDQTWAGSDDPLTSMWNVLAQRFGGWK